MELTKQDKKSIQGEANKTLHLVLKRKWWDMIASGEKKEEYRDVLVPEYHFPDPLIQANEAFHFLIEWCRCVVG